MRDRVHRTSGASAAVSVSDAYPSDLDELRRLGPEDRALLYLSLVEQRTFVEIASLLDISEPAARKRSSRALARLRHDLSSTEVDR